MMTYNLIISFLTGFLATTALALPAPDNNAENIDLTRPVTHTAPHIQYPRADTSSSASLLSRRRRPPMTNNEGEDTLSPDFPDSPKNTTNTDLEPRAWPGVGPRKWCKDFTWIDETSDASPLLKDCVQIVANHAAGKNHGGDWVFMAGQHRIIATAGTCAFGVSAGGGVARGQWLLFGSEDVKKVVEKLWWEAGGKDAKTGGDAGEGEGLSKLKEKMGGKGMAKCLNTILPGDWEVEWSVYHT